MALYRVNSFAHPTTAPATAIALTSSTTKTVLQVKMAAAGQIAVIPDWGVSFDGTTAGKAKVELLRVSTACTVTSGGAGTGNAYGYDQAAILGAVSLSTIFTQGTTSTGFNASAEATTPTVYVLDTKYVDQTGWYDWSFSLGQEPSAYDSAATYNCIRITSSASCNVYAYMNIRI